MSWLDQTTRSLVHALQSGDVSSRELTQAALDRIEAVNPQLNAFLSTQAESALAQAASIDSRRLVGESMSTLAGLPVAVKDVIAAAGQPCTCGSRMLANYRSPYNSHVIDRLAGADAIVVGRTNLDEFAMGSSGENSAYGVTRNPWNVDLAPGGSSSGSAVAVAGRMTPVALGSDTGGSIRQPAAFCGIVGLKPTYGRVSRYGLVAYASSLDQIGPFAPDVFGVAAALQVIAGFDRRDSTSVDRPVDDYLDQLDQPLSGLRIGVAEEHFSEGLDPDVAARVRAAVDVYRSLGAEVKPIRLPHAQYCVATYYLIASSEASSNLARYDGVHYGHRAAEFGDLAEMYSRSRSEGFGPEVKRRIMLGAYALSAGYYDQYYVKALRVRRLIRQDFDAAFQQVDFIAGPTTPSVAYRFGEKTADPLTMYLGDIYTIAANLAGLPAVSLPCGINAEGLPIGLQLQGRPFDEANLLRAARMLEAAGPWITTRPAI